MADIRETSTKDVCNVCHDDIEIYAVGKCDHFVCYKCSTRMRLLCKQMYCATCRADLPEVFFMTQFRKFEDVAGRFKLFHKEENIFFENEKLRNEFFDLLSHKCKLCPLLKPMKTFRELELHMRRDHSLHYCDICVKDLKVFTAERKCYTREELARHRRLDDVDDKSFKGHPLCELCDQRYLDRDELARHCRKEHYYCHFCESDGLPLVFFGDYSILKDHFKDDHYLCEEGECIQVQFTNAFRSEIDLKAHKTTEHSRHMNKAEIRQARTIEVDFQLAPRHGPNRGRGGRNKGRNRDYVQDRGAGVRQDNEENHSNTEHQRNYGRHQREQYEVAQAVAQHLNQVHRESGAIAVVDRALVNPSTFEQIQQESASSNKQQVYSQLAEDFPTLSSGKEESASVSSEEASKTGSNKRDTLAKKLALSSNLLVQDGDIENGDFPSLSGAPHGKPSQNAPYKGAWQRQADNSDFPALSTKQQSKESTNSYGKRGATPACSGSAATHVTSWAQSNQVSSKPKKIEPSSNKRNRVPSEDDFPSLHSISNILMNTKPAAPGLSRTKLSSSSSTGTSSGVGHGQPITNKIPEKSQPTANFTTEDFPVLDSKKLVSDLPNWQGGSKPKETNYSGVYERTGAKSARQTRKQPAPMPDFTDSSKSEKGSSADKLEKSGDDDNKWVVVKSQRNVHGAVEEKNGKEVANSAAQQLKSKKSRKSNKKKLGRENGAETPDFSYSDSERGTASGSGEKCQGMGVKVDGKSKISSHQNHKLKSNKNSGSEDSNASSSSGHHKEADEAKSSKDSSTSCSKITGSSLDAKPSKVDSFPSFTELSETTNILPLLSAMDEFPALLSGKQPTAVPPGFTKSKSGSGPPPGFTKPGSCMPTSKPPPGFNEPCVNDIENIAPLMGGDISAPRYIEPVNFKARNEKLITDIREMLSAEEFNDFKSCSGEFRRSHITAKEYYNNCRSIMGGEQFGKILPELISLLPDIERQQELLAVYSDDEVKVGDIIKIKQTRKPAWKSNTLLLSPCTICRQVVLSRELSEHVGKHDLYMDFPTLSSISASLVLP